jgi:hypothetical protein
MGIRRLIGGSRRPIGGADMRSILIAQREASFATAIARSLSSRGYNTIICPGPWPPARCIRCDVGYCPLTEAADLMIYDPDLAGRDRGGAVHNLAFESTIAHPDVPLLLARPGDEPEELIDPVSRLVGRPFAPGAATPSA